MTREAFAASVGAGTAVVLALLSALLAAGLNGCASPFARANCARFNLPAWNILICDDEAVNRHCHNQGRRFHSTWDDGRQLDASPIAGCWEPSRKAIVVGRSHLGSLPHEICHAEGLPIEVCAQRFPEVVR